jgi:adenylate kinase
MRTALRTSSEILRTASAHAMADNQRSLIDSFTAARAVARFRPVLFDGHTLIDNDAGLVEIPLTVIAALRIRHIVFVSEDVSIILERRRVDTRKRPSRTLNELTHHQDLARSIARTHADSLAIPFYEIQSGDLASLIVLFEQASRGR